MKHTKLFKSKIKTKTADGVIVEIIDFDVDGSAGTIPEWATHILRHYCADGEIDILRAGTGKSRNEFIRELIFPSAPHLMAAEFAEILVADFIEFCEGYHVPRVRYFFKVNPNVAVNGVDIIGFRKDKGTPKNDKLISCEVKASLVKTNFKTLQNAIDDAGGKDPFRIPETLNAFKQRLLKAGDAPRVQEIERYQNRTERPYVYISGAACVHSDVTWDSEIATDASCKAFPKCNFHLLAIKGPKMMELAKQLYEAACA